MNHNFVRRIILAFSNSATLPGAEAPTHDKLLRNNFKYTAACDTNIPTSTLKLLTEQPHNFQQATQKWNVSALINTKAHSVNFLVKNVTIQNNYKILMRKITCLITGRKTTFQLE